MVGRGPLLAVAFEVLPDPLSHLLQPETPHTRPPALPASFPSPELPPAAAQPLLQLCLVRGMLFHLPSLAHTPLPYNAPASPTSSLGLLSSLTFHLGSCPHGQRSHCWDHPPSPSRLRALGSEQACGILNNALHHASRWVWSTVTHKLHSTPFPDRSVLALSYR